jgi:hypothetical protein
MGCNARKTNKQNKQNIRIKVYRIIILPFISYGFETWCLILRKEHRMRVFANWLQRKTCESRMDDVKRDWRKLHNDELHN